MQLNLIVNAIKERTTFFNGRVAVAAKDEDTTKIVALGMPAAVVIPLDDIAGEQVSQSGYRQTITGQFILRLLVSNQPDEKGEIAYAKLDEVKAQIFKALLGWKLNASTDYIRFSGGSLYGLNSSNFVYDLSFSYDYEISTEETYLGNQVFDELEKVEIKTDKTNNINGATITNLFENE